MEEAGYLYRNLLNQMVADRYDPERDITPRFVETVAGWLAAAPELFVVLRYLRAAGAKACAFIQNEAEFQQLVHACPEGTDINVFRDRQLPIRGTVSPGVIAGIRNQVPEGAEYLVVCTSPERQGDLRLSGNMGDTHATLIEDLTDIMGQPVAAGLCPRFIEAHNDAMISASKGGIDGLR